LGSITRADYATKTGNSICIRTAEANDASAILRIRRESVEEGEFTLLEPGQRPPAKAGSVKTLTLTRLKP
jgi:hypothetical protein